MRLVAKIVLLGCLGFVVVIAALAMTGPAELTPVASAPVETGAPLEAKRARRDQPVQIAEVAKAAYTRDQYPVTFAKFGPAIPAVNADRLKAASIAAKIVECDSVENAQVTTRSPRSNRRYWVECGNLTRIYFDQDSLAADRPVAVQTEADWIAHGLKDW